MTAPILITGAGQRIGLAFAKHCLDRGQPVIVTYRSYRPAVDALPAKPRWKTSPCLSPGFWHPGSK
jgi:NAD(P)-dependent dehydrogenase (short-subunit alcohol dehydrogenase family)